MKYPVFAIIAAMMIAGSSHAVAQSAPSADAILKRLDALERENRVLRDEVRLLARGKSNTAAVAPTSPPPTGAMAMAPAASRGPVYQASNPSAIIPYNWTGLYVGAHFGGGLAQKQWTDLKQWTGLQPQPTCLSEADIPSCAANAAGSHNATGLLGGIQIGYNWQFGHWVFGIEGQYSFADLVGDHQNSFLDSSFRQIDEVTLVVHNLNVVDRLSTKVDGIGTIAGRIGFASESMDRTLFYVKGGAAYARDKYTDQFSSLFTDCSTGVGTNCGFSSANGAFSGNQNRWGWMAGTGLEYGLTENWSAKIEYDYLDFGTKTVNLQGTLCSVAIDTSTVTCSSSSKAFDIKQNIQMLKFGVNYRFN